MRFHFVPITPETARVIGTWEYPFPYSLYNPTPASLACLLEPGNRYFSAHDDREALVGFCCFGPDARTAGGCYESTEPEVLDMGAYLRPDLTVKGLALKYLAAIMAFAAERFPESRLRVTIAEFNQRSARICRKYGFQQTHRFVNAVHVPFVQLEYPPPGRPLASGSEPLDSQPGDSQPGDRRRVPRAFVESRPFPSGAAGGPAGFRLRTPGSEPPRSELRPSQPGRPESRRPESRRPEPRRSEPRRPEPRRSEPRRSEPRRSEPQPSEPRP